jgi:hypothetical protein
VTGSRYRLGRATPRCAHAFTNVSYRAGSFDPLCLPLKDTGGGTDRWRARV